MSFPNLQDRVLKLQGAEEVHFHSLATEKNLPRRKTCKSAVGQGRMVGTGRTHGSAPSAPCQAGESQMGRAAQGPAHIWEGGRHDKGPQRNPTALEMLCTAERCPHSEE